MSTLSFVVCAYKESPYLRECLQSLLLQTVECPVLVSTSTPCEQTEAMCRELSIPLFINTHKPGIAADWNSAYSRARSEYIVLAHQDDIYRPDYAETAISFLDNARHPLLFFSDYYEIRNGKSVYDTKNLKIKRMLLRPLKSPRFASSAAVKHRILSLGNPICCPAVTFVRDALPDPPFLPGMSSNLDWDAWERFSRLAGSFEYAPRPLVGHRVHEASTTSLLLDENRRTGEDLRMLKRFWPAPAAAVLNHFYKKAELSNTL